MDLSRVLGEFYDDGDGDDPRAASPAVAAEEHEPDRARAPVATEDDLAAALAAAVADPADDASEAAAEAALEPAEEAELELVPELEPVAEPEVVATHEQPPPTRRPEPEPEPEPEAEPGPVWRRSDDDVLPLQGKGRLFGLARRRP